MSSDIFANTVGLVGKLDLTRRHVQHHGLSITVTKGQFSPRSFSKSAADMCRLWSDLGPITSRSDELVVINIPQQNNMFLYSTFIFWGVFLSFLSFHFLLLPRLSFISTCSASPPALEARILISPQTFPNFWSHLSSHYQFIFLLFIYSSIVSSFISLSTFSKVLVTFVSIWFFPLRKVEQAVCL